MNRARFRIEFIAAIAVVFVLIVLIQNKNTTQNLSFDVSNNYKKQELNITPGWKVVWNEFYDIDPLGSDPQSDKDLLIFSQEDLLYIRKGDYHIDLGWYGHDPGGAFGVYLYRGQDWKKCQLLEANRRNDKNDIVKMLNEWIASVDRGDYDSLEGYVIDQDDKNNPHAMEDHLFYSALKSQK